MNKINTIVLMVLGAVVFNGCATGQYWVNPEVSESEKYDDLRDCHEENEQHSYIEYCMEKKGYILQKVEDPTGTMFENLKKRK